ncbi:hypothetical protein [Paraburkholderia caffeinitolerans]|uniref:hypothetical protein n=1 Tax=Paraburkholderia caffeinitolerans TaxID=1723730 RepID=UPI001582C9DF|nr:hypothetical protein [Paraburkholderia caffeinitolerans]
MFTTYRGREFVFTQRSLDVSFSFTEIGDAALPHPLSVHDLFTLRSPVGVISAGTAKTGAVIQSFARQS